MPPSSSATSLRRAEHEIAVFAAPVAPGAARGGRPGRAALPGRVLQLQRSHPARAAHAALGRGQLDPGARNADDPSHAGTLGVGAERRLGRVRQWLHRALRRHGLEPRRPLGPRPEPPLGHLGRLRQRHLGRGRELSPLALRWRALGPGRGQHRDQLLLRVGFQRERRVGRRQWQGLSLRRQRVDPRRQSRRRHSRDRGHRAERRLRRRLGRERLALRRQRLDPHVDADHQQPLRRLRGRSEPRLHGGRQRHGDSLERGELERLAQRIDAVALLRGQRGRQGLRGGDERHDPALRRQRLGRDDQRCRRPALVGGGRVEQFPRGLRR